MDLTLRECPSLHRQRLSEPTDRHALPGTLRVSAGRVLRAVAGCGPGGVLRAGADPDVPVYAVEHDQDAEPPPPQHAGQRGARHRAV